MIQETPAYDVLMSRPTLSCGVILWVILRCDSVVLSCGMVILP